MPKRTGLTEQIVARAALDLLDREGLDGLTMRRLAAELEVSPMTLYSYVADREALLDTVAQTLYAQVDVPAADAGPREALRELMRAVRRVLLAHPQALALVATHPPRTLEALAFVNAGYGALRRAGVPAREVARSYRALAAYSLGTATIEVNDYFDAGDPPARGPTPPDEDTLHRLLPYVDEVAPLLGRLDDEAEFDYGLDLTLDELLRRHMTS